MKLNRIWARLLLLGVGLALIALVSTTPAKAGDSPRKLRIGIYQSRAIAVAFAPSKYNTIVKDLMTEMKKAEAAGDQKKIAEIKKQGEAHQKRAHRQAFGQEPVDDILVHIKGRLPEVARAAGVDVIVAGVNWSSSNVETVDVTNLLVKEFNPSPKTLNIIEDLLKRPPIDMDALGDHVD